VHSRVEMFAFQIMCVSNSARRPYIASEQVAGKMRSELSVGLRILLLKCK